MTTLKSNIGKVLTPEIAALIAMASEWVQVLVSPDALDQIRPEIRGEFVFACERMEDILEEIKPLHAAHWAETEEYRHGLEFNPNYEKFIRFERAGRAIVFTLRNAGKLVGHFSVYVSESMHTQTLMAREDALYLLPEARKGRTSARLIAYAESGLRQLGVKEIDVSVKVINRAGRFFRMLGYKHVEDGLNKIL
jgi:GNAT superfamily N-acetyltransferase